MTQTESIIYNTAFDFLKAKGFNNAKLLALYMVAQSKHETGNYTSRHFKESNNAFGYARYAGSLYQIGAGSIADNKQPVGKYKSVADSTKEVAAWISRRKKTFSEVRNLSEYGAALKSHGYYGDSFTNYYAGLKRFFSGSIPPPLQNPLVGFIGVVVLITFYLIFAK